MRQTDSPKAGWDALWAPPRVTNHNAAYFAQFGCRADPLVRGRPPGRPLLGYMRLIWWGKERVQGDPLGPGGPPY
jgi:hypothetical protein